MKRTVAFICAALMVLTALSGCTLNKSMIPGVIDEEAEIVTAYPFTWGDTRGHEIIIEKAIQSGYNGFSSRILHTFRDNT